MAEEKKPNIEPLLQHIRKMRADAIIGKKKHYNAADRKDGMNLWFGVPPVIINILLGSLLFGVLADVVPNWMKWVGAMLAFIAAALVGIQTFFNWPKQVEGHRRLASRYLFLGKDCAQLLMLYETSGIPADIQKQVDQLSEKYKEITLDAESFGVSQADYDKAIEGIKKGEEEYTVVELGLESVKTGSAGSIEGRG